MKTLKYIALSLLVAASTTACKDDPELLTTDVGPEMTVVSPMRRASTAARSTSR